MDIISSFMNTIINFISNIEISYVIDIIIIAFVFYKVLRLIEETRAEQLVKGFIIILVFAKLSEVFNLYAVNFILSNMFTVGLLALVILFQPEIRKALEHLGRSNFFKINNHVEQSNEIQLIINEIVDAASVMSRKRVGALIVIERVTGIKDIVETGTQIDAKVSSDLLMNIFYPNSPLHDGAVIVKDMRISAAGCFLPLSDNKYISKELGTRHRAAMGMSESSDALIVVVSEETGAISLVDEGNLQRYLDTSKLRDLLADKLYREKEREEREKAEREREEAKAKKKKKKSLKNKKVEIDETVKKNEEEKENSMEAENIEGEKSDEKNH